MSKPKKTEKPKVVVLKYDQLFTVLSWIDTPLHSEQARARNRITALLKPAYDKFQEERIEMLKQFAETDEKGDLKKGDNGKAIFKSDEDEKSMENSFVTLCDTDVEFSLENGQRADWAVAKEVLAKTQVYMDVKTTATFESILAAFEAI